MGLFRYKQYELGLRIDENIFPKWKRDWLKIAEMEAELLGGSGIFYKIYNI